MIKLDCVLPSTSFLVPAYSIYFKPSEFACRCCKNLVLEEKLLIKLAELRKRYGGALKINSGYRCPAHNTKIGGAKNSFHVKGMAADVSTAGFSATAKHALIKGAVELFGGVGIAKNYVHVDVRPNPKLWVY